MTEEKVIQTMARIDSNTAVALEAQMKAALSGEAVKLVFDLGQTGYVSSAGLRVFLSAQKKCNAVGGEMVLRNVKPAILEIFEVTGLSGVLTVEYGV